MWLKGILKWEGDICGINVQGIVFYKETSNCSEIIELVK